MLRFGFGASICLDLLGFVCTSGRDGYRYVEHTQDGGLTNFVLLGSLFARLVVCAQIENGLNVVGLCADSRHGQIQPIACHPQPRREHGGHSGIGRKYARIDFVGHRDAFTLAVLVKILNKCELDITDRRLVSLVNYFRQVHTSAR